MTTVMEPSAMPIPPTGSTPIWRSGIGSDMYSTIVAIPKPHMSTGKKIAGFEIIQLFFAMEKYTYSVCIHEPTARIPVP